MPRFLLDDLPFISTDDLCRRVRNFRIFELNIIHSFYNTKEYPQLQTKGNKDQLQEKICQSINQEEMKTGCLKTASQAIEW